MNLNAFVTQLKIDVDKKYFSSSEERYISSNYAIDNKNVDNVFSDFVRKYPFLTANQLTNLNSLIKALQFVVPKIHPDKIEMNQCINNDDDLMFWKESSYGFSEILLHDDGDVSCYFISKISNEKSKALFEYDDLDFETILYNFLKR